MLTDVDNGYYTTTFIEVLSIADSQSEVGVHYSIVWDELIITSDDTVTRRDKDTGDFIDSISIEVGDPAFAVGHSQSSAKYGQAEDGTLIIGSGGFGFTFYHVVEILKPLQGMILKLSLG